MNHSNGGRGRGSGRGRSHNSGGRGHGRSSRGNSHASAKSSKPKAKGECEALGDAIFACGEENQAETFNKTQQKIFNYIFTNFEQGKYVKESLENREEYDIEQWRPEEIEDGTQLGGRKNDSTTRGQRLCPEKKQV